MLWGPRRCLTLLFDFDGALHVRMQSADVGIGAWLGEGQRFGLAFEDHAAAPAIGAADGDLVRRIIGIGPGDGLADFRFDFFRTKKEIADRDHHAGLRYRFGPRRGPLEFGLIITRAVTWR